MYCYEKFVLFRRYFIDNRALTDHFRTKGHKRRLKDLELEPYTSAEADRAAGRGSFYEPKKRKIETQPHNNDIVNSKKARRDND